MASSSPLTSLGLLILRVSISALMLVHGVPKLLGYRELSTTFPDPIGLGSQLSLILAIGAEVGCSLLLILGLGTRLAAIPLAITMLVALFVVHADHGWAKQEIPALFLLVYTSLIFTGAGKFSLDALFSKSTPSAGDATNP